MSLFRSLGRTPGFVLAAVLTLALGLGGNVACFSVIRAVLLKPLGYQAPDRLVLLSGGASPVHFAELQAAAHNFSSIGAYAMEEDLAFTGRGTPEVLKTNRVSAHFLDILGVSPLLGQNFTTPDHTALISYRLWQQRFQGDFQVLGQTIDLGGRSYTITGVLPPHFAFPSAGLDVWLAKPEESPQFSPPSRALSPFLTVFGRLKPGVTLEQATAELLVLQSGYAKNHPAMLDARPKSPPTATPLQRVIVGNVQRELWLLFGAVGLVLLITCANLASLLLARAAARSAEFAIRSALGASRSHLIKRLLTESLLLSLGGGITGALFAFLSLSALRQLSTIHLPRTDEIRFDTPVFLFAIALSLFTGIVFGLAPAISASRVDLMAVLRASQSSSPRVRLRSILVAAQIALSVVLLIGTTLLLETILRLRTEPLGFDSQNLLTAHIALPPSADSVRFFENVLQRLTSLPGVEHASFSLSLPMTSYPGTPVQNASQPPLPLNQRPLAALFVVTPDYFQTLRIPLKRGRTFTERDRDGTQRVAVIDENCTRHFWPGYPAGPNPIGQRLLIGGVQKAPAEIIGIVGNAHQDLAGTGWNRGVYVSLAQAPIPSAMLALRVKNHPLPFAAAVRHTVQSVSPAQPVSDLEPMQSLIDAQLGPRRLLLQVLACFAVGTLVLVLVGIYGLMAYSVTQRRQEWGIRRALGAPESRLVQMILTQAARLALSGVAVGVVTAYAGTRVLKSYLFHTSPTDPIAFLGVSGLFLVVALAAAFVPALRAAQVDPSRALRYE